MTRLPRYAISGAICALLSNTLIIVLTHGGLGVLTAAVLAFVPVLLLGYLLHAIFTFRLESSRVSFMRYTLVMLANFPLWSGCLYVLCTLLKLPVTLGAPLTTALVFLWSYAASHWAFTGLRSLATAFGADVRR